MSPSTMAPIAAMDTARIALCVGCENPVLVRDLLDDAPAMQCPRCGTIIRPADINTYELAEGDDAE